MLTKIQFWLITIFVRTLALLPRGLLLPISRALHFLLRPFMKKELAKLYLNVERIYQLPRHSSFAQSFARQVIQHQIISGLESLVSSESKLDPISVTGFEELEKTILSLKSEGRGVVVVTAHLGMWEFVAKYCAKAARETFNALAKPSKAPGVTLYMDRSRGRMNTKVLWTDRKSLLKDMIASLRKGEILGFVMDQKPEGRKGPEVQFFEQPTKFVSGPAKLAVKMKSPVLGVFCMREGPCRYRILHKVILEPNHQQTDEQALTQAMASEIEAAIRLYPEQWVWNYKRWRFQ